MTTQTVSWCTSEQIDCGVSIPTTVYLCVPASIVVEPANDDFGFVEAEITVVRESTCSDSCGPCKWVYTFEYDDEQVTRLVSAVNITKVICGCDAAFVISQPALLIETDDTDSVDMHNVGLTLSADVNISADADNIVEIRADGLYVPDQYISSLDDTDSIDLTNTAGVLTADVLISATAGNQVSIAADGLLVPQAFVRSISDTSSVDLAVSAGDLTANVLTDYSGTWTPVVTASGSMTVSGLTISLARFFVLGSTTFFDLTLLFTLGGTQSTAVYVTLPNTAVTAGNQAAFPANVSDNGGAKPGSGWRPYESDLTKLVVFLPAVANWTLGAGASINIQGRYKKA